MTNLHGWRLATGFPSQTKRGSPFGLLLAIALSAMLWAAIVGAAVILLR